MMAPQSNRPQWAAMGDPLPPGPPPPAHEKCPTKMFLFTLQRSKCRKAIKREQNTGRTQCARHFTHIHTKLGTHTCFSLRHVTHKTHTRAD